MTDSEYLKLQARINQAGSKVVKPIKASKPWSGRQVPGTKGKKLFMAVSPSGGVDNFTIWNADSAKKLDDYLGHSGTDKLTIVEVTDQDLEAMKDQICQLSNWLARV